MEIDISDKLLNTLNSRYRLTDAEERLLDGLTNNLVEVVLYYSGGFDFGSISWHLVSNFARVIISVQHL